MASAGTRDVQASNFRYFARSPPLEALDDGVHCFGEAKGITPEEYKRRRHLVTEEHDVTILDARAKQGGLASFDLETHGFMVFEAPVEGVDFTNKAMVKEKCYPKLLEVVQRATKARDAFMTQHLIRTENPINLTMNYARFAHCDAGPDNVPLWRLTLKKRGVPDWQECEILMFNIWHPFDRPAYKDPLCLLDFSSVNFTSPQDGGELVRYKYQGNSDMKDRDGKPMYQAGKKKQRTDEEREAEKGRALAIGPVFSPKHRWYYIPDQKPEEAWLFKQYDTRDHGGEVKSRCSFHNSFHDPFHDKYPDTPGRRSVEYRGLLTFPKGKAGDGDVLVAKL